MKGFLVATIGLIILTAGLLFYGMMKTESPQVVGSAGITSKPIVKSQLVRDPVFAPSPVPEELSKSFGGSSPLECIEEIELLQNIVPRPDLINALRFLMRTDHVSESIKNEAGKVLIVWNYEPLSEDLFDFVNDSKQSEMWRVFSVQLIELLHDTRPSPRVLSMLFDACRHSDAPIRSQALFSLSTLSEAQSWQTSHPKEFDYLSKLTKDLLLKDSSVECKRTAVTVAGNLCLKDCAESIEKIACNKENEIGLRVAAVNALGNLGLSRSKAALQSIKNGPESSTTLSQMTSIALSKINE